MALILIRRSHVPTLIALMFLVLSISTTSEAMAQNVNKAKTVTFSSKSLTRGKAISEIETQTGYKIAYNLVYFDADATVNFHRDRIALEEALKLMIEGTGQTYSTDGNNILIYPFRNSATVSQVVMPADRSINGVVTNKTDGDPQDGVRVELVANNKALKQATTSIDGHFVIEGVVAGSHILKLTSADGQIIRYREVNVSTDRDANVNLELAGDMLTTETTEQHTTLREKKTTTYYIPNTPNQTIKAFEDEPQSEYGLTPLSRIKGDYLPKIGVKTNFVWLGTASPNVAIEFGLARKWTLDASAVFNPFELSKTGVNRFWLIQPEVRYWFCQRFEKHFVGLHGIYGGFNIGDISLPFTDIFDQHRYKGWGAGVGLSYGYHLPIAKHWALEFTVGAGYVYLQYDKFRCYECDEFQGNKARHYFGPTKAGISLIFMIK